MNWFNLKDLENRLIKDEVSDREGYYYLLANLILFGLAPYATSYSYNSSIFSFAEVISVIAITFFGVKLSFKANQNGNGSNYFKRFVALYFVIGIRLTVFTILLAIPVGIVVGILESSTSGELIPNKYVQDTLYLVFYSGIGIVYYYLLVRSFKTVAQSKPAVE